MKKLLSILCLLMVFIGCKKPFDPPNGVLDDSILVIEGTIAVGNNSENVFKLSRLRPLQSDPGASLESNAAVNIISSGGSTWPVQLSTPGIYKATLNLPENDSYKLVVQTLDGNQYESPLQQAVLTPEIDSITWKQPDELNLFVHTHDASNSTRYYRWEYEETWEYNSWFEATLDFKDGQIVSRPPEEQVFTCWRSDSSELINIGNTVALTQDVISYQPLTTITQATSFERNKLGVRYSILVKQLGITKEAYNFWNILKKNTELTGTLFDPQPSKMPSNIKCTNNPGRESIGFISVGKITQQRIFIRHSSVPLWPLLDQSQTCSKVTMNSIDAPAYLQNDPFYSPVTYVERTNNQLVYVTNKSCMDCTLRGGNNVKPAYW